MKVTFFRSRWALLLLAGLLSHSTSAQAQRPIGELNLIRPVEVAPIIPVPVDAPEQALAPSTAPSADSSDEQADDEARELIKELHPNGALRVEREIIQDAEGNFLRHGQYREYDIKGNVIVEGQYSRGRRMGEWRRVHAANQAALFQTAPYKQFRGPYVSQATFADDVLDGKWIISDAQQRKISEIDFVRGERHGKALWFHPNGALMTQIVYDRSRVHGEVVQQASDTTILASETYQNGRKLGTKIEYHPNKSKHREISYLHAMLFPRTTDDWDKAELATFEERGQDEKHGPFTIWHANGSVSRQGEFRYNMPVGKISYWFENGQKQLEGLYTDGKQDGDWTWYHKNGQKAIVGQYRDGVAIGKWTWWKGDGKVAQKFDYSSQRPAPIVQGLPKPIPEREAELPNELSEPAKLLR
jgi:antitoxin component YwqK of YwqJK toxin-antitoxin module